MARQLRIEYDEALYHVMSRGNEQRVIFWGDEDRLSFMNWNVKWGHTLISDYNVLDVSVNCLIGRGYSNIGDVLYFLTFSSRQLKELPGRC